MRTSGWSKEQALKWCTELESIAIKYKGHVALTGGLLYKQGTRKDMDVLVYPVRGELFDWDGFFGELETALGVKRGRDFGWCKKATTRHGLHIDFFDPLEPAGTHSSGEVVEEWLA